MRSKKENNVTVRHSELVGVKRERKREIVKEKCIY